MPWNLDSDRPIFIQIIDRIQADIIAGCYQPGDKLPSVRELAQDASVNPNTMQKALSELERTGLVYSQRTSGRFITEDREMIRALREQQGQQIALHFLENMKKLGYGKDEILALLTQLLETALHNQPHSTETHGHSAETHGHSAETHTHSAETHVYSAETHGHSIAPHAQPYNAAVHAQPEQKQQHKSSAQESLAEACKITTWRIP
jgi:DNA-binding transcriptional regulator YhcF (GntR family)